MRGVAFDLGGPAFMAFDQQPVAAPPIVIRPSRNRAVFLERDLRLPDITERSSPPLSRAGRETAERQRRAHQLQKAPARDRIDDRFYLRRELVAEMIAKRRVVGVFVEQCARTDWEASSVARRAVRERMDVVRGDEPASQGELIGRRLVSTRKTASRGRTKASGRR